MSLLAQDQDTLHQGGARVVDAVEHRLYASPDKHLVSHSGVKERRKFRTLARMGRIFRSESGRIEPTDLELDHCGVVNQNESVEIKGKGWESQARTSSFAGRLAPDLAQVRRARVPMTTARLIYRLGFG